MTNKSDKVKTKEEKKEEAMSGRTFHMDKIKRIKAMTESEERFNALSVFELGEKSKLIQRHFEGFESMCLELLHADPTCKDDAEEDAIEALCVTTKKRIFERMQILENENTTQANECVVSESVEVHTQQKYEIGNTWGTFDGEIRKWFEFSKKFKRSVHTNSEFTTEEKFAILKYACQEQVKRAVIELNEDDYEKAWDKLCLVYGNAYTQMHFWTHSLVRIAPCTQASSDSIRQLLKKGNLCVENLSEVTSIDKFEAFLVPMIASKMDSETMRVWERNVVVLAKSWAESETKDGKTCDPGKFMPTWENMQDFLKSEVDVYVQSDIRLQVQLVTANKIEMPDSFYDQEGAKCMRNESLQLNNVQNNSHKAMAAVMPMNLFEAEKKRSPKFLQCVLCDNIHPLYKCDVFLGLSLDQKYMHVEEHNLCLRCLRDNHPGRCVDDVSNQSCPKCLPHVIHHNSKLCPQNVSNQRMDANEFREAMPVHGQYGPSDSNWGN